MYDFNNLIKSPFYAFNNIFSTDKKEGKRVIKKNIYTAIFFNFLSNIILGFYSYKNIDVERKRQIERSFFYSTVAGAINDNEKGLLIAPLLPNGTINTYGFYNSYQMVFPNGETREIDDNNCVVGFNSDMSYVSDYQLCIVYAERLAELSLTIDNSFILTRCQGIITGNSNKLRDNIQLMDSLELGEIYSILTEFDENNIKLLQFEKPTSITSYFENFRDVINEFLSITGFSSLVNPNKSERLITAEVSGNEDIKNTLLLNRIENRKIFIDNINKKFNQNIDLLINPNVVEDFVTDFEKIENRKGGNNNASE